MTDNWPLYPTASRDHLHAVGVLITEAAQVEAIYNALIQLALPYNIAGAVALFDAFNNAERQHFIREVLLPTLSKPHRELVDHFLRAAGICTENRNTLAHARTVPTKIEDLMRLIKGKGINRKDPAPMDHHISLAGLRQMADEANATHQFGWHIWSYLKFKRSDLSHLPEEMQKLIALVPLPQKPPLPRTWGQYSQPPPAAEPPQPQPSAK